MNRITPPKEKDQQRQKQQGGGNQDDSRRQHRQDDDSSREPGKDPYIQEDDSVADVESDRKGRPPKVEDQPR
jgi:hypothetical protein